MGISVTQLLIILAIVVVLFGTKRLRNLGADLGAAIKSFRSAVKETEEDKLTQGGEENTVEKEIPSSDKNKV